MKISSFGIMVLCLGLLACEAQAQDKITNYICRDGSKLAVEFTADAAKIGLPDGSKLELPQQQAASGILYSSDRHELRGKGDVATWTVGKKTPTECTVEIPAQ